MLTTWQFFCELGIPLLKKKIYSDSKSFQQKEGNYSAMATFCRASIEVRQVYKCCQGMEGWY